MGKAPRAPQSFRLTETVLDLSLDSLLDVARWRSAFAAWGIDFDAEGLLTVRDFQRLYPTWEAEVRQFAWSIMRMKPMIVEVVE